jgi:ribosomal protein L3 glutamine methyltransferase
VNVLELIEHTAGELEQAGLSLANGFGQGSLTAFDEAAWLVLWSLKLPLNSLDEVQKRPVAQSERAAAAMLLGARISQRKPLAYLTQEAWLQGVAFYVDERVIIPRSLIAELIADESIDPWLVEPSAAPGRPKQASAPSGGSAAHAVASVGAPLFRVLDLCTGNGSLAVLAAMAWPEVAIDAADISRDALEVAQINLDKHQLTERIRLIESDGLAHCPGPYDLIICNPPYVNARTMAALPPEFLAEPAIALSGNAGGGTDGMDFIGTLLGSAAQAMSENAVLVLEIGNERANFERAFPALEPLWFETSAGPDQVLLLTRQQLIPT